MWRYLRNVSLDIYLRSYAERVDVSYFSALMVSEEVKFSREQLHFLREREGNQWRAILHADPFYKTYNRVRTTMKISSNLG